MTEYRPPIDAEFLDLVNPPPTFGDIQPLAQALASLEKDLDDGKPVKALHVGTEEELQEMKRRHEQSLRDKRRRH